MDIVAILTQLLSIITFILDILQGLGGVLGG